VFAQGSLTPPGAPAATMKSLDQIEARTMVNSNNTPGDAVSLFKITNSGSYYFAGNLTGVSNKHGILIAAPNVTLDLNGFSLIGVPGSLNGISATNGGPVAPGLIVRNGVVSNWGQDAINTRFGAPGALFSKLTLLNNVMSGLRATECVVSECAARGNSSSTVNSTGFDCYSSHVMNCMASGNYNGFGASFGGTVESCVAVGNTFGVIAGDSSVLNCTITGSTTIGIYLFNRTRIAGNMVNGSGLGTGLVVANGSSANTIDSNMFVNHATAGIKLDNAGVANNLVIRNTARANGANNYLTGAGNSYGPIVNVSGLGDISSTNTSSHPWANFSY
jgi:hypothetical protein